MAGGAETVADAPIGIPEEEKRERRGGEEGEKKGEEGERGSDENNDMLRACTMVTCNGVLTY